MMHKIFSKNHETALFVGIFIELWIDIMYSIKFYKPISFKLGPE